MGREINGGWRRKTRSIWSQEVFMIKNFYRGNAVLLQVQVNPGRRRLKKRNLTRRPEVHAGGTGQMGRRLGSLGGDRMREKTTNLDHNLESWQGPILSGLEGMFHYR